MEKLIQSLKQQIQAHIENGGSIYDDRRSLPYYFNLRYLRNKLRAHRPETTIEDVYALCGYEMDREYHRFKLLNDNLLLAIDTNGYVDDVKSKQEHSHTKHVLNMLAEELGCSPSDYLVLMTKFRYQKAIVQRDYISQIQQELLEKYPDGDITGIRHDNPKLYEKLRHFKRYAPEDISMSDILEYFGVTGSRFRDDKLTKEECELIKANFREKYNPETIENIKDFDFTDYQRLNTVAIKENISIFDLLAKLGYHVKYHANVSAFSRTIVDAKEREQQLLTARKEIIKELLSQGHEIPQTDKDLYYFNKKVAQMVLENIYSLTPIDD